MLTTFSITAKWQAGFANCLLNIFYIQYSHNTNNLFMNPYTVASLNIKQYNNKKTT